MNSPTTTATKRRPSGLVVWQLVAVALIIMGCKLWLIGSYGSALPFLDQWKGEGAELLRPWMKGSLRASDLFAPFNEHRIVPSRVLVLGLFEANSRQWDSIVQMVAGAALHAGCAFVLGLLILGQLGSGRKWPVIGALLVLFCLPFDWQNTLWGFQSQFYFLILFTLLTFWGLAWHAAGTARWWCGAGAGLLACFSMASGGFSGLALATWLGVKFLIHPEARKAKGNWATLGVSLALGALGFALYTPPKLESLTAMHVQSPGAFLHGFAIHLGWPNSASPLYALLAFSPFAALLALRSLESRQGRTALPDAPVDELLFPLGIWVGLQAAALAWSRNHAMASVISRYMDLLALGALVNFCCHLRLASFISRLPRPQLPRRALLAMGISWTAVALAGMVPLIQRNFRLDLPSLQQIHRIQAAAVRQFLITGQEADLGGKPVFGLPPADLKLLAELLRDPVIQNVLPTGLGVRRTSPPAGPLTEASRFATDAWGFLLGGGVLILFLTITREWLSRRGGASHSIDQSLIAGTCATCTSAAKRASP